MLEHEFIAYNLMMYNVVVTVALNKYFIVSRLWPKDSITILEMEV